MTSRTQWWWLIPHVYHHLMLLLHLLLHLHLHKCHHVWINFWHINILRHCSCHHTILTTIGIRPKWNYTWRIVLTSFVNCWCMHVPILCIGNLVFWFCEVWVYFMYYLHVCSVTIHLTFRKSQHILCMGNPLLICLIRRILIVHDSVIVHSFNIVVYFYVITRELDTSFIAWLTRWLPTLR